MLFSLLASAAVVSAAPWGLLNLQSEIVDLSVVDFTSSSSIFDQNPELFALHRSLVEVRSISNNEWAVSEFLRKYLKDLDLGFEFFDPSEDNDGYAKNIYAYKGANANASVLLTSHIDTVPPYIGYKTKTGKNGDVEIHGRGSCDAKASVAAQIIAAKELIEEGKISADDLALLYVIGEEIGGPGMIKVNRELIDANVNWDAVVFGEPTESKLAVGHKGLFLADLVVHGLASHSGYPEIGIDADKILIDIMHDLEHHEWPTSERLNGTTINIGQITGGPAANVVSPHAYCRILMRTAVSAGEIATIVKDIVSKYEDSSAGIELNIEVVDDPVDLDYDIEGFETYIASYATDIPKLDQRGFKRYLYGPGSILVAHGDNEFVYAKDLLKAVDDYKKMVLKFVKK